ncbi:MAG: hypothetical protein IKN86_02420 [Bacteroidaceae bacterium]|nr:hypothetical protein [Bacteroidaceae bacterium]
MKKYIVPELDFMYCETQIVMTSIDDEDAEEKYGVNAKEESWFDFGLSED